MQREQVCQERWLLLRDDTSKDTGWVSARCPGVRIGAY